MKDYYKILGVSRDCSQADIKKAYRLMALQYHPDKNSGDKASEERFKEISESYIILGDVAKRNAYDYTKGHHKNYRGRHIEPGKPAPVTFLILFRRIKDKVLHANGYINREALFKVINDLLSDETINLLINARDVVTNNIIIDDVLVCCVFLDDSLKSEIYARLTQLADGDPRFINKLTLLDQKKYALGSKSLPPPTLAETDENPPVLAAVLIFIVLLAILICCFFL